jgi:DNA-directed RNA polymerase specialized sigma24 family protein
MQNDVSKFVKTGIIIRGSLHQGATPAAVEAIIEEVTGVINKTINTVPPLYRDVLRLRYRESKPLKAISKHLKVPLGTVKARLSRGSDILKDALNFQQTTVRTYLDGRSGT